MGLMKHLLYMICIEQTERDGNSINTDVSDDANEIY